VLGLVGWGREIANESGSGGTVWKRFSRYCTTNECMWYGCVYTTYLRFNYSTHVHTRPCVHPDILIQIDLFIYRYPVQKIQVLEVT
jgi:hypothetical protein